MQSPLMRHFAQFVLRTGLAPQTESWELFDEIQDAPNTEYAEHKNKAA
jgi:hypothetical protein